MAEAARDLFGHLLDRPRMDKTRHRNSEASRLERSTMLSMKNTISNRPGLLSLDAHSDLVADEEPGPHNAPVVARAGHPSCASASTETYFRAAAAVLAMRSGSSGPDMSAALLKRHYGVTGSIGMLSSEVERTVEVDLPDGRRCILKTSTRREAADSFRFQTSAMAGLEGAAGFVAPAVLRTSSGALMFEEERMCGYLQTRIEGISLHQVVPTPRPAFSDWPRPRSP
jgi:hypothetical protein